MERCPKSCSESNINPLKKSIIYRPLGLCIPNHPPHVPWSFIPVQAMIPDQWAETRTGKAWAKLPTGPPLAAPGGLSTWSQGKVGWVFHRAHCSLLALKANHCHHLNYMIRSLIQYNQAHCLRAEHLAETLSQSCSNLAGEELILTISTFSFSIE